MTFNTGNPIGSTDARDRSDNSENLDLAVNSLSQTFVDRLGVTRDTLEGVYQKSAYYRAGTFDAGYTLTNNRQTLAYGNIEYSWSGAFPKVVAAGSTPATSGGIGAGAWVDRTQETLRLELSDTSSDSLMSALLGYKGGQSDGSLSINVLKRLRVTRYVEEWIAGDGVTDDTSSLQAAADWVTGGSFRKLVSGSGTKILLSSGAVTFDFAKNVGCSVDLLSAAIIPGVQSGNVIEFINTEMSDIYAKAVGGGVLADYSLENPTGGQNVFYIRGLRNCNLGFKGFGCKSRIIKHDVQLAGEIKTSMNTWHFIGTEMSLDAIPVPCGQAYWFNGSTAFGTIISQVTNWDSYGPILDKVVDFCIMHIEGGWHTNHGIKYKGCGSGYIHSMAVGDETNSVELISIEKSTDSTQLTFSIHINTGLAVGGTTGLSISDTNSTTSGVSTGKFKTTQNSVRGVYLNNYHNCDLNIYSNNDYVGIKTEGNNSRSDIKLNGKNFDFRAFDSGASSDTYINVSGGVNSTNTVVSGTAVKVANAASTITFKDFTVRTDGASCTAAYDLPTSNGCYVMHGEIGLANGVHFITAEPSLSRDVKGYVTERCGNATAVSGNSSITVPHGMNATPAFVFLQPTTSNWPSGAYVSSKDATNFIVTFPSSLTNTVSFDWRGTKAR